MLRHYVCLHANRNYIVLKIEHKTTSQIKYLVFNIYLYLHNNTVNSNNIKNKNIDIQFIAHDPFLEY